MDEPARVQRLARIVDSPAFAALVLGVIVANAVVLGLQTYDDVDARHGTEPPRRSSRWPC